MEAACDRFGLCVVVVESVRDKVRDSLAERVARRAEESIAESVDSEKACVGNAQREYRSFRR